MGEPFLRRVPLLKVHHLCCTKSDGFSVGTRYQPDSAIQTHTPHDWRKPLVLTKYHCTSAVKHLCASTSGVVPMQAPASMQQCNINAAAAAAQAPGAQLLTLAEFGWRRGSSRQGESGREGRMWHGVSVLGGGLARDVGGVWMWSVGCMQAPIPNLGCTVCSDLHLQEQTWVAHRGGWCLPWSKGMNLPLTHGGSSLLQTFAGCNTGMPVAAQVRITPRVFSVVLVPRIGQKSTWKDAGDCLAQYSGLVYILRTRGTTWYHRKSCFLAYCKVWGKIVVLPFSFYRKSNPDITEFMKKQLWLSYAKLEGYYIEKWVFLFQVSCPIMFFLFNYLFIWYLFNWFLPVLPSCLWVPKVAPCLPYTASHHCPVVSSKSGYSWRCTRLLWNEDLPLPGGVYNLRLLLEAHLHLYCAFLYSSLKKIRKPECLRAILDCLTNAKKWDAVLFLSLEMPQITSGLFIQALLVAGKQKYCTIFAPIILPQDNISIELTRKRKGHFWPTLCLHFWTPANWASGTFSNSVPFIFRGRKHRCLLVAVAGGDCIF